MIFAPVPARGISRAESSLSTAMPNQEGICVTNWASPCQTENGHWQPLSTVAKGKAFLNSILVSFPLCATERKINEISPNPSCFISIKSAVKCDHFACSRRESLDNAPPTFWPKEISSASYKWLILFLKIQFFVRSGSRLTLVLSDLVHVAF